MFPPGGISKSNPKNKIKHHGHYASRLLFWISFNDKTRTTRHRGHPRLQDYSTPLALECLGETVLYSRLLNVFLEGQHPTNRPPHLDFDADPVGTSPATDPVTSRLRREERDGRYRRRDPVEQVPPGETLCAPVFSLVTKSPRNLDQSQNGYNNQSIRQHRFGGTMRLVGRG